ncbi:MAG TPA: cardiolipin synthase [Tepidisphaeraceae bacterium]|jgi:cardiolipin synthase|nr:cardiolipin synthase [Tepidisphaeraceae bacterium]
MTWFALYIAIAWLVRLTMIPVILRRQMAPGASIAWLGIIFLHPYIGVILYLFLGETRLGPHRVERHKEIVAIFRKATRDSTSATGTYENLDLPLRYEPMVRQAERISGFPVLGGNQFELLRAVDEMMRRLIADIDAAVGQVHLLYYIYADDAIGGPVAEALARAAGRGVNCKLLLDAVGARAVLQRDGLAARLTQAGVSVAAALPAHVLQRRLPRMDLRNHRKLAIIDEKIAYVGSHNLINPDYGGCPVGPWVDLSARIVGPAVAELAAVFAEDWAFETEQLLPVAPPAMETNVPAESISSLLQIVPTGPIDPNATYRRVLLAAIQSAHASLTLTTPYFVPDEPTLVSLLMAADRGVKVALILPARPDHAFTAAAGRAHFSRLMEGGISIYLYRPGLLHAKTVVVDDALAIFGSANLDVRSFNLNFELSVLIYGREAVAPLNQVQANYLADSHLLSLDEWSRRSTIRRYVDSAISLLSPLL